MNKAPLNQKIARQFFDLFPKMLPASKGTREAYTHIVFNTYVL